MLTRLPRPVNRFKISHRKTILRVPAPDEDNQIATGFTRLEAVASLPKYVDYGPDAHQYHASLDDGHEHVGQRVDKIWKQYLTDVVQKIGNPIGTPDMNQQPSYCILPPHQRSDITMADLQDPNLANIFRIVNVKRINPDDWEKLFTHLFPYPNHQLPFSHQHFNGMSYYGDWGELINEVPGGDVIAVQRAVKKEFDKLAWAPAAQVDRIWIYQPVKGLLTYPGGYPTHEHAPKIVWNPKRKGQPIWIPSAVIDLREEEEESGDDSDEEME
jgi:hypothetical protein